MIRLSVEGLLFFVLPAVATGVLYFRIISNLLNQEKRVSRNRVLSITFFLSWLLWVLCWTPGYILSFLQLPYKLQPITYGYETDAMLFYMVALKTPLEMLYSHLNPVVFVILLNPLKEFHARIFRDIYVSTLVDEVENDKTAGNHGWKTSILLSLLFVFD